MCTINGMTFRATPCKTERFDLCLHVSSPTLLNEFRVNLALGW